MQDNSSQENIQPANLLTLPNPIDIYLGRRIALIRAKACLSRQTFADKLGISEPLLDRFERGAEKIPASLLWYVAVFLEQDIDTFFATYCPKK